MITVIIGLPGSGKSCYGAYLVKKWNKKGIDAYTNYEVDGAYYYNTEDLGRYLLKNGNMILDEAGIDISNRDYLNKKNKSTDKLARSFYKKHRHYGIGELVVLSQAWDFDKTVRNLAMTMYIIKRSIIPHFSYLKRVKPYWDLDQDGQPCIKWKIIPILFKPFYRKPYYKYYDSYDRDDLPFKEWRRINVPFPSKYDKRCSHLDQIGRWISWFINTVSSLPDSIMMHM